MTGNRTGVNGFAGRCATTPPRRSRGAKRSCRPFAHGLRCEPRSRASRPRPATLIQRAAAMPTPDAPRMAIVGAGPSGLAALRALTARASTPSAYERGGRVGRRLDARGPADRRLPLAAPDHEPRAHRVRRAARCPTGTPDYPSRDAVGRYLEELRRALRAARAHPAGRRGRARARRRDGGGWELELGGGRARARRRARRRQRPQRACRSGPTRRTRASSTASSCTRSTTATPTASRGRRVLVVGMGNSAMDIATDLSHVAERTLLSVRHGSWVIPKRLLGKPADQVIRPWVAVHVPWRLRQPLSQLLLRVTVGPPERYGLPAPRARPVPGPPDDLRHDPQPHQPRADRAQAGHRGARPATACASPTAREEPVDAIVWCTGYRVAMPVPRPTRSSAPTRASCRSTSACCTSTRDDLFFVGLMQSTGSAFPIVERQSQLLAEHLTGTLGAAVAERRCAPTAERRRRRGAAALGRARPARRCAWTSTRYMHELGAASSRADGREHGAAGVSRRALVTGASGAFGTALRARLRARGWQVAGLDLRARPGDADVLACDVTDADAVPRAVAAAIERLGGGLDALVNNAGIGGPASAGEPPDERVRQMLDVNLLGRLAGDRRGDRPARGEPRPGGARGLADGVPRPAAGRRLRRVQARAGGLRRRAARRVRHARRR